MDHIVVRCYGDLAELAGADREGLVDVPVGAPRRVRDVVEALGIPTTEVDLVVVDGASVGWGHLLTGGARVAVYPPFSILPAGVVSHVRPAPPSRPHRFLADVPLRALADRLGQLGVDTRYATDVHRDALAARAVREARILLTRDRGLLLGRSIVHGLLVRSTDPREQLTEVIQRFGPDLSTPAESSGR